MQNSPQVQDALSRAAGEARTRGHESVTPAHLIFALLSDPETADALRHAGGDLAGAASQLDLYLDNALPRSPVLPAEPSFSQAVERIVRRAGFQALARAQGEIRGPAVLVALFAERDTPAITILDNHGVTRAALVSFLNHGVSRAADGPAPRSVPRPVVGHEPAGPAPAGSSGTEDR